MTRFALLAVLLACGSKVPPAPKQPPPPAQIDAAVAVPTVTCTDVGVILGGPYAGDPEEERADFDRDAAITTACELYRWPQEVRECIGSTTHPSECIEQLPTAARSAYEEIPGREGYGDHGAHLSLPEVTCEEAIGDAGTYAPALDPKAPEREWVVRERYKAILHECDHGWSSEVRFCLQAAIDAPDVHKRCLDGIVAPDEIAELTDTLEKLDKLGEAIAKAKKKPSTIGCKQVVAAHYSDAKWKGKATTFNAKERKRLIKESRERMTKACTADAWDATLRACIVAGGDSTCFESHNMALSWGYPAAGTVKSMGIAECDAYRDVIQRIVSCNKMDPAMREQLGKSFEQMQAQMAGMTAEQKATAAKSCKAGADAVAQLAAAEGC